MLLRDSKHKGQASYAAVLEIAAASRGDDRHGLRAEFLELVQAAQRHSGEPFGAAPLFPVERAVVSGEPRVMPQPVASVSPLRPSSAAPHRLFGKELGTSDILLAGIALGSAASFLALAATAWLIQWHSGRNSLPLAVKPGK
jgi:hypothetical protein